MSRRANSIKEKSNMPSAVKQKRKAFALRIFIASVLMIIIAFAAAAAVSIAGNRTIRTAEYTVKSEKLTSGLRIVLISDLHRRKFDETNQQLIDLTAKQSPDLICVDGDMIERHHTEQEADDLISLFERLSEIAPVCFSAGNHDYLAYYSYAERIDGEYIRGFEKTELTRRLEETGAVFLENDYTDVTINGENLRIGGFYAHACRRDFDSDESWRRRQAFLEDYCSAYSFKLMLSHRPDSFTRCGADCDWDIDLVLSGHTHNGVITLPFGLGAVWASGSFFPKYARGQFDLNGIDLIITAGLDGYRWIPRVFNPPEITVIDITPQ